MTLSPEKAKEVKERRENTVKYREQGFTVDEICRMQNITKSTYYNTFSKKNKSSTYKKKSKGLHSRIPFWYVLKKLDNKEDREEQRLMYEHFLANPIVMNNTKVLKNYIHREAIINVLSNTYDAERIMRLF